MMTIDDNNLRGSKLRDNNAHVGNTHDDSARGNNTHDDNARTSNSGEADSKKGAFASKGLRDSLSDIWPGARYLSLGLLFAWMYLVLDFGAWMTGTDDVNVSVIDVSMRVYTVSAVVLFAAAIAQNTFRKISSMPLFPYLSARLAILGVLMLILSGPRFLQLALGSGTKIFFQVGSVFVGIGVALLILQVGQLYCSLSPNKVFLYALLSEILVAILFYVVVGNAWLVPIIGGPPLGNLLAVAILPALASFFASLPAGSAEQDEANSSSVIVSISSFFKAVPMARKLLIVVFVFTCVGTVICNCFMFETTPGTHQLQAQQAMLLRLGFSLCLMIIAVFVYKGVSLGKLYLFGMVSLALVVVALPLLGLNSSLILVCTSMLLEMINLVVWCLLSFVSRAGKLRACLVFGLGMGCAYIGRAIGYALNYYEVLESIKTADGSIATPYILLLMMVIIICVVLIFTEKDFDAILEVSGAAALNMRAALERKQIDDLKKSKERPWRKVCWRVGERYMLSEREQEVFEELSQNRTPPEIAKHLNITVATVRTHTHRIYAKLDVHSRDQLVELVREEYEHMMNK